MKQGRITFFIAMLFFVYHLNAQQTKTADSTSVTSLQKGAWALQFRISENFSLQSFSGTNISAKYHFTGHSALRFGISFSGSVYDTFVTSKNYNSISVAFDPKYIYYPWPDSRVNLFWGIGPMFEYEWAYQDWKDKKYLSNGQILYIQRERTNIDFKLGISGTLGVEVFLLDFFSLHAEYGSVIYYVNTVNHSEIKMYYSTDNPDDIEATEETIIIEGYKFSYDRVLFGLSVYF